VLYIGFGCATFFLMDDLVKLGMFGIFLPQIAEQVMIRMTRSATFVLKHLMMLKIDQILKESLTDCRLALCESSGLQLGFVTILILIHDYF